jgi:hypothetical protein
VASDALEAFRRAYMRNNEAFNRHDFEAAFERMPPDCEWHVMGTEQQVVAVGPKQVRGLFEDLTRTLPDYRVDPQEFIEVRPGVVVVHNLAIGTGEASGATTRLHFWQLWELPSEGRPMRIREYPTEGEALEAAAE